MRNFLLLIVFLAVMSCNTDRYGQGGNNACQFVKEQVPGLRYDIENVEVIEEDTLLMDQILAFNSVNFAKSGVDFWEGRIKREEYMAIIDSTAQTLDDIMASWTFPQVVNDSLRQVKRYDGCWRKVYTVRVKMKNGTTKEPRVLMERDGITPKLLEMDFVKQLDEYERQIRQATEDCIFGK